MYVAISHRLPGRIRLEIEGTRLQPILAYQVETALAGLDGILEVTCNPSTGRALIRFDEKKVTVEQITSCVERTLRKTPLDPKTTVAATTEAPSTPPASLTGGLKELFFPKQNGMNPHRSNPHITDTISPSPHAQVPVRIPAQDNPYRFPTLASVGALGFVGIKRLLIGRSAFAAAPIPFYIAAAGSILAGYPALRRGVERPLRARHANPDLLLGAVALGLAAMRENLVALSAITLLNIAMFRRHQVIAQQEATHLPPDLERYSRTMTRTSFLLSPLTWLFTGSPLRALGVLLAANPRPAILAHKYAWAQAERQASEQQLVLPRQGHLENLAYAQTIVLANGAALTEDSHELLIQSIHEDVEQEKAAVLAASLLEKIEDHPLRAPLFASHLQEQRTHRTAFDVEQFEAGVSGTIGGHEVCLGSKAFLKERNIDLTSVLLQERRMRREGYKPYILVQDGVPLALIGCKQQIAQSWRDQIDRWQQRGFTVRCLQDGERPPCQLEMMTRHELINELEQKRSVLLVGEHSLDIDNPYLVSLSTEDVPHVDRTLAFCRQVQEQNKQAFRIVNIWNKAGIGLAMISPLTAPLINLLGDFLGVFLLSRHEWQQRRNQTAPPSVPAQQRLQHVERHDQAPYHALEQADVIKRFSSRPNGLTAEEVIALRQTYGYNQLEAPAPLNPLRIFLGQFKEFSTMILLGATGLSLFMGEWFNALCMGGILVVNAMIGTYQEVRSAGVLQALKDKDESQAKVIRGNTEQLIPTHELVPGDIVLLEAGDMVPADLRILESWNLEVNEAILTGESLPASKKAATLPLETQLADRHNLMYMGTIVTRGRVRAIVVATGADTQIGALQSLLHQEEDAPTPLQQRVGQIGKRFVTGALIAGAVVAVAGLLRGIPPIQLVISSITLAASAIPEGLPLTITIALTAGVMRMAKRKAVVRKLASLESLGRVTVICSDKTGTLTRNEMTVKEVVTINEKLHVTGEGYRPEGAFLPYDSHSEVAAATELSTDVQRLLTIGLLCNNSTLEMQGSEYEAMGDPTETALLTVARKANLSKDNWHRHREIPFDSNTGSMSVVCQDSSTETNCLLLTKGSPEAILKKCTHFQENGEIKTMTEEIREQIVAENLKMAEQALRVLGFAYRELCADEDVHTAREEGLIYVGLMGMIDPPKEDVAASIEEARRLGIKPVMITGDHPITARAIGAQLGIYRPGDRILTGEDLEQLSPDKLAELVSTTSVFARVSPEHKLRIVEAYQRNGEIVAMTGDGVNDAPAVRKANVGIAMGAKGTDITKNTAGIVLMEDHFQAIVEGIKEGRTIIGNIRKAIGCLLTGNLAEVLVTATAVIVGLPMPLIPLQILLMNLLTDALPAMVLATDPRKSDVEPHYQDVVDRPLYRKVITRGIVLGLGALGVFAFGVLSGLPLPIAQSMTFATLVAGQLIQTVSWRQMGTQKKVALRQDRSLLLAMSASWLALALVLYLPPLQGIFATAPLGLLHWATVLAVAGSVTTISSTLLKRVEREEGVRSVPLPAMAA